MTRTYIDINTGELRKLELLRPVEGFIKWHKLHYMTTASLWKVEDGTIVQVPDNAWNVLGIPYKDEV